MQQTRQALGTVEEALLGVATRVRLSVSRTASTRAALYDAEALLRDDDTLLRCLYAAEPHAAAALFSGMVYEPLPGYVHAASRIADLFDGDLTQARSDVSLLGGDLSSLGEGFHRVASTRLLAGSWRHREQEMWDTTVAICVVYAKAAEAALTHCLLQAPQPEESSSAMVARLRDATCSTDEALANLRVLRGDGVPKLLEIVRQAIVELESTRREQRLRFAGLVAQGGGGGAASAAEARQALASVVAEFPGISVGVGQALTRTASARATLLQAAALLEEAINATERPLGLLVADQLHAAATAAPNILSEEHMRGWATAAVTLVDGLSAEEPQGLVVQTLREFQQLFHLYMQRGFLFDQVAARFTEPVPGAGAVEFELWGMAFSYSLEFGDDAQHALTQCLIRAPRQEAELAAMEPAMRSAITSAEAALDALQGMRNSVEQLRRFAQDSIHLLDALQE